MMQHIRLFITICFVLSCTRIVDVPMPPHEPKLVLHGYVETGKKFTVAINQTVRANSVLTGDETYVDNAWVLLYEDNIFVDSLKYDAQTNRYVSQSFAATAGKTYKVVAGADGFTTIEAIAQAILPANAVSVVHEKETRVNADGEKLDDISFSFNDRAGEKNFYLTALYPSIWSRQGGSQCVYSNDPAIDRLGGSVLPFEDGGCIDSDNILFADKSFDGMLKQVSLSVRSASMKTEADSTGRLHRPFLKRSTISEDHYRYLKTTLSLYIGGLVPSLNEPIAIKGNVKNGYGLLSVYSVTTDTLR